MSSSNIPPNSTNITPAPTNQPQSQLPGSNINDYDLTSRILSMEASSLFSGLSMSLSGKFPPLTQQQMRTLLRKHGAQVSATPRKKTQYIICGDKCTNTNSFPSWCILVNKEWVYHSIQFGRVIDVEDDPQAQMEYVVIAGENGVTASKAETQKRKRRQRTFERIASLVTIDANQIDQKFKFPVDVNPGNRTFTHQQMIDYQKRISLVVPIQGRHRYVDPYADLGEGEVLFYENRAWSEMYCRMCVREHKGVYGSTTPELHSSTTDPSTGTVFQQPVFPLQEVYDEYYLLQLLVAHDRGIPKFFVLHNRWGVVGQGHSGVWQKSYRVLIDALTHYRQLHYKLTENELSSGTFIPKQNCFVPQTFEIPQELMKKRRDEEMKRLKELQHEEVLHEEKQHEQRKNAESDKKKEAEEKKPADKQQSETKSDETKKEDSDKKAAQPAAEGTKAQAMEQQKQDTSSAEKESKKDDGNAAPATAPAAEAPQASTTTTASESKTQKEAAKASSKSEEESNKKTSTAETAQPDAPAATTNESKTEQPTGSSAAQQEQEATENKESTKTKEEGSEGSAPVKESGNDATPAAADATTQPAAATTAETAEANKTTEKDESSKE